MNYILIILWLLVGLAGSGFYFAYFQDNFPSLAERDFKSDLIKSLILLPCGPISLVIVVMTTDFGKYGCRLWRKKKV